MSTRLVLADDHPVVRRGLVAMLAEVPDFMVVGEARNGMEAVQLVERLQPDVLIVDVMMPGMNGLEVTRRVSRQFPRTRIVVLSMHAIEAYVLEALRNGAAGYVLKDSEASDLVEAVRAVGSGRRYLSPPLSERAVEVYVEKAGAASKDPDEMLTAREREVLHLAIEGANNAKIAARLSISPRTAETHRGRAMRKLGLRSQADMLRYAFRKGLLPLE